ncbi:MAG: hydratase, partial [Burkholderiales bacterium]|nr:hydratase [Burkholderiales bacterium]
MPSLPESQIRVACLQLEPIVGDKAGNVRRSLDAIASAAAAGATVMVLPELCNSGYVFETRQEAFALAETIPDGPTTQAWMAAAQAHGTVIVAGISERDGDALYNSAVVVGPEGYIGRYRKNHLWGAENLFFEPGNLGMPVFRIGAGRIAVAICYDIW